MRPARTSWLAATIATALATVGCDNGAFVNPLDPERQYVALVAPENGSSLANLLVTFRWTLVGDPPRCDATLFTDKGEDPLDGSYEDSFDVGSKSEVTVSLNPQRYVNGTFFWAVRCGDLRSSVWRLSVRVE